mmetsp:Transcript_15132/g.51091  ORF Transcript_15132/g.51091 Transcript_15132/m.51091 type:complete len:211 (+) Transcript_15132:109-741(+)
MVSLNHACLRPSWHAKGKYQQAGTGAQKRSFRARISANTSASALPAMARAARTVSAAGRRNGLVSSSSPMVVGTVGRPSLRRASICAARARRASFSGSTVSEKRALAWLYSWAQNTTVSRGSLASFCKDSQAMAGVPSKRRPQPRTKRESPTKTRLSLGRWKAMWPVVCPLTSITCTGWAPREKVSPSETPRSMPGMRCLSAAGPMMAQP